MTTSINVGAPADIAIMELRQGRFGFVDNYGGPGAAPADASAETLE